MTLSDRIAAAYAARLRSHGQRAPGRFAVEVAGLLVVSLGVDERWGTQIAALVSTPDPAAVDEAVAWCRERGRNPQAIVREEQRDVLPALQQVDTVPALVVDAGPVAHGLEVGLARDAAEFVSVYRAAFRMRPGLAEALVVEADLASPDVTFLVARDDGRAIACAQLRTGEGMTYVSGVGVLPELQGRGVGTDMLAACRAEAAGIGSELVWLSASERTRPFYEAIGFTLVDTHIALVAP